MSAVRLLLIDTNLEILSMATRLLQRRFEIIGAFSDGASALKNVLALNPDVVLLDISLGDVNGFEIARRIKLLGCSAKTVFFSMHEHPDFIRAAIAIGAVGYVFKDRAGSDLLEAIERVSAGGRHFPTSTNPTNAASAK
jgi:DNA-binding NarL/FixJ family response regulator